MPMQITRRQVVQHALFPKAVRGTFFSEDGRPIVLHTGPRYLFLGWSAELCYGSEVPFSRMVDRIVLRVRGAFFSDGRPNCVTD